MKHAVLKVAVLLSVIFAVGPTEAASPKKGKASKLRPATSARADTRKPESAEDGVILDVVLVKRRVVQPDGTMRVVTTAQ